MIKAASAATDIFNTLTNIVASMMGFGPGGYNPAKPEPKAQVAAQRLKNNNREVQPNGAKKRRLSDHFATRHL